MPELRKDYILERWVIISQKRAKRPNELSPNKNKIQKLKQIDKTCAFCAGNEKNTPKETFRITQDDAWIIRGFKNKFGAVSTKKGKAKKRGLLKAMPAYGHAEIIVESPYHDKQLADMPIRHIKILFSVFSKRIQYYLNDKSINYVSIFKNHNKEAGASIKHSHSQLIAYNQIPAQIKTEIGQLKSHKSCLYCKIIKLESKSKRLCFETKNLVAIAPFASQYSYELSIYPKRHVGSLSKLTPLELLELSYIVKKALLKLKTINAPYNFYMHGSQHHENMHFHLDIKPRLNTFAGFELETGTVINPIPPEKAAIFYQT